ncbi:hypothetical protein FKM82_009417 [Ascaphus truei]
MWGTAAGGSGGPGGPGSGREKAPIGGRSSAASARARHPLARARLLLRPRTGKCSNKLGRSSQYLRAIKRPGFQGHIPIQVDLVIVRLID